MKKKIYEFESQNFIRSLKLFWIKKLVFQKLENARWRMIMYELTHDVQSVDLADLGTGADLQHSAVNAVKGNTYLTLQAALVSHLRKLQFQSALPRPAHHSIAVTTQFSTLPRPHTSPLLLLHLHLHLHLHLMHPTASCQTRCSGQCRKS